MFDHVRCVSVHCDQCHGGAEIDGAPVHFNTTDQAIRELTAAEWRFGTTTDTGTGADSAAVLCPRCTAARDCARHGHLWEPWRPCECQGSKPAHRELFLTVAAITTGTCASQVRWCERCDATDQRATPTMEDTR
jgi:hypothetical protein